MTTRLAWIVAAAMPLFAGCLRAQRAEQQVAQKQMQNELRFQEDRIYQLEDWIRQYNHQLTACRTENVSLRGGKATGSGRGAVKTPARILPAEDADPKRPGSPDFKPPEIEIPPLTAPPAELPNPKSSGLNRPARPASEKAGPRHVDAGRAALGFAVMAAGKRPEARPHHRAEAGGAAVVPAVAHTPAQENPGGVRLSSFEASSPQDKSVARITLNATLTAPLNHDGRPGDDGIMVVIEPRNKAGELIPPAGDLNVSILDPAAASEVEARIGRWNYSTDETAHLYRRTTLGDGIQLNLLWQEKAPSREKLELFVRLTTPDGRKLLARRQMTVSLAPSPPAAPAEPSPAEEPRKLEPEPVVAEAPPAEPAPAEPKQAAPTPVAAEPEHVASPSPQVARSRVPVVPVQPQPENLPQVAQPVARPSIPMVPLVPSPIRQQRPAPRSLDPFEIIPLEAPEPIKPQPIAAPEVRPPAAHLSRTADAASAVRPIPQTRILPVRPAAEEYVAIPAEGKEPGEAASEPAAAVPAPAKPEWAPFRR